MPSSTRAAAIVAAAFSFSFRRERLGKRGMWPQKIPLRFRGGNPPPSGVVVACGYTRRPVVEVPFCSLHGGYVGDNPVERVEKPGLSGRFCSVGRLAKLDRCCSGECGYSVLSWRMTGAMMSRIGMAPRFTRLVDHLLLGKGCSGLSPYLRQCRLGAVLWGMFHWAEDNLDLHSRPCGDHHAPADLLGHPPTASHFAEHGA